MGSLEERCREPRGDAGRSLCACVCVGGSNEFREGRGVFFLERKSERQYQVAQESQGAEMSQCLKASEARVAGTDGSL